MSAHIRMTDELHDRLLWMASRDIESGAVMIAKVFQDEEDQTVLLAMDLIDVPEDSYEDRTHNSLQITSDGYVHALKAAREVGAMAVWVHSHPGDGARPLPSVHDHAVNEELQELFSSRTESNQYGYLIVANEEGLLTFSGAITGAVEAEISGLTVLGRYWRFLEPFESASPTDRTLFDRNIRAFGESIQTVISRITVAIVGAGGTGSSVAEQLARLGVRHFVLIDPDLLSLANTTRVYGSTPANVGQPKVDVLGDHLQRIADGVQVRRVHGSILDQAVAKVIRSADVVFGCTDDNAGRLRLSRLPYYYLVPVIDCGVQIDSDEGGLIRGIFGRVTTLFPGSACLICRDRIDLGRADAETRSAEEQGRLEKEGYAPALGGAEPAVVAYTTTVAAGSVCELLERLLGYGDDQSPTEQIFRIHDRVIRANVVEPVAGHYCDTRWQKVGSDRKSYLEMNWTS